MEAIKKARTKRADLGHPYSWEITPSFLHELPSSYESFVEIILNDRGKNFNRRLSEPDLDVIMEQLLDQDYRQKLTSSNDTNGKAMLTNNKSKGNNNGVNNNNSKKSHNKASPRPKCDDCDLNHGEKPCWLANPDQASEERRKTNKDRIVELSNKKRLIRPVGPSVKNPIFPKAACAQAVTTNRDDGWYFDNAASFDIIYSKAYFIGKTTPLENPIPIETADGRILEATAIGRGSVKIFVENDQGEDEVCMLSLNNLHYAESFHKSTLLGHLSA